MVLSAVVAQAPAVAEAAHPRFSSNRIVPGQSIGGLKLGMSLAGAKQAWGAGATCEMTDGYGYCQWRAAGDEGGDKGEGRVGFTSGKVDGIRITAAAGSNGYVIKEPFTKPKTSKGIRIGSKVSQVRKAYPKIKTLGMLLTLKTARARTVFMYFPGTKRVVSVEIARS